MVWNELIPKWHPLPDVSGKKQTNYENSGVRYEVGEGKKKKIQSPEPQSGLRKELPYVTSYPDSKTSGKLWIEKAVNKLLLISGLCVREFAINIMCKSIFFI